MPISPGSGVPLKTPPKLETDTEDEEQTPWLALTMFSRTLEFDESDLKNISDQLRNGNTFKIGKPSQRRSSSKTYTFKMRTKRRTQDQLREYWLTNDTRREFLKDYDSGAYKTRQYT